MANIFGRCLIFRAAKEFFMKKAIVLLMVVCMLFCLVGCSMSNDILSVLDPAEEIFSIDSCRLQITADSTFQEKTGGSFDMQITNGKCYISIMAYRYTDLTEGITPQDVFDIQNEDLFGKRDNVLIIDAVQTQSMSGKSLTQAMYSAEKDGVENYYLTYLVDLPDKETVAWVLVTAAPSYVESNREYLHNIVCSLTAVD